MLLCCALALFCARRVCAQQVVEVSVEVGQTRSLAIEGIIRVIVLNPELVDVKFDKLQLHLTGLKEGRTYLHYWTDLGRETLRITVTPAVAAAPGAPPGAPERAERLYGHYELGAEVGLAPTRLGFGPGNFLDIEWNLWQQPDEQTTLRSTGTFRFDPLYSRLENGFVEYRRRDMILRAGDVSARLSPLTVDLSDAFGFEARQQFSNLEARAVVARRRRGAFSTLAAGTAWASGLRIESDREASGERRLDYGLSIGSIGRSVTRPTAVVLGVDLAQHIGDDLTIAGEYARDLRTGHQAYQARFSGRGRRYAVDALLSKVDPEYRLAVAPASERLSASDRRFYVRLRPVDELLLYYTDWGIVRLAPSEAGELQFGVHRRIFYGATLRVANLPALTYERETVMETTPGSPTRLREIDAFEVYGTAAANLTYRIRYEDETQSAGGTATLASRGVVAYLSREISEELDAALTMERRQITNLPDGRRTYTDFYGISLFGRRQFSGNTFASYYVGLRRSSFGGRPHTSADFRLTLTSKRVTRRGGHGWRAEIYYTLFGRQSHFRATLGYTYIWNRYKAVEKGPKYEGTGRLRGTVFLDANGNGTRDSGEEGIAGARLTLDGARELPTDPDGWADWGEVPAGEHEVRLNPEDIPEGMVLTSASPQKLIVPPNEEVAAQFGVRGQATLAGAVFVDADGDHRFGAGDFGVANVPVTLAGVGTTTTDTSGHFVFRGITPGKAKVSFDPTRLPANFIALGPVEHEVDVQAGAITRVEFEVDAVRSAQGVVFLDLDGDGERDAQEPGVGGLVIRATSEAFPERKAAAITAGQGAFTLRNLPPGKVRIFVDFATNPPCREGPGSSCVIDIPAGPAALRNVILSVLPQQ